VTSWAPRAPEGDEARAARGAGLTHRPVEIRTLILHREPRVECQHAPFGSANRMPRSGRSMTETRFRQAFLLLLVTAISAAFVAMIRVFLVTILLAAIFTGLSYPLYQWVLGWLRGHKALAAIVTLVLVLALVIATAARGARNRRERSTASH
jgi:hypothetical protein